MVRARVRVRVSTARTAAAKRAVEAPGHASSSWKRACSASAQSSVSSVHRWVSQQTRWTCVSAYGTKRVSMSSVHSATSTPK